MAQIPTPPPSHTLSQTPRTFANALSASMLGCEQLERHYKHLTHYLQQKGMSLSLKLDYLTQRLSKSLNVSRASLWALTDEGEQLRCLSLYSSADQQHQPCEGVVLAARDYPHYFAALNGTAVIDAHDALTDPRTREFGPGYLLPLGIKSMLDATLRDLGKTRGVICLEMVDEYRQWREEEAQFASLCAEVASQVLLMEQLRLGKIRHKALYEDSSASIFILDGLDILDCNPAAIPTFGANSKDDIIGKTPLDFSPTNQPDGTSTADLCAQAREKIERDGGHLQFTVLHHRLDKTPFWAEVSLSRVTWYGATYFMSRVKDVTTKIEAQQKTQEALKQLEFKATHDTLTGLPNRDSLHAYICQMLEGIEEPNKKESSKNELGRKIRPLPSAANDAISSHTCSTPNTPRDGKKRLSLILFDIDRFKEINDTLGHQAGDKVLQTLAQTLQQNFEPFDLQLFRLGGDEFASVCHHRVDCNPTKLPGVIQDILKAPIDVDGSKLEIQVSMGVANYPEHGKNSHELLRCADIAMYEAKQQNQDVTFFKPSIDNHSTERLSLLSELSQAIRKNQLQLFYQPRIAVHSGELVGCEALIRWPHPTRGMIPPDEFIPLAETTDLIHDLTRWVMETAASQAHHWKNISFQMPIAVNLSARNLSDADLLQNLDNLFEKYHLNSELLELEITESALMNHPQRAISNLHKLNDMGIKLAIDDFGTGYSSLSYLKQMPINILKIDRSFVKDMMTDDSDRAIVSSTIDLAHSFSLQVVAEGVEDADSLDCLAYLGCDQAQGYHIAKPMPINEFELWVVEYLQRQSDIHIGGGI